MNLPCHDISKACKGKLDKSDLQSYHRLMFYCLQCQTGQEAKVKKLLEIQMSFLSLGSVMFLYPQRQIMVRKQGKNAATLVDVLPGYIMCYCPDEIEFPAWDIKAVNGVFRILKNPDGTYCLRNGDERFAIAVFHAGGVLKPVKVDYEEGGKVVIKEGVFKDLNARIVSVDKRKSRLTLEIVFDGNVTRLNLSMEAVLKTR